MYTISEISKISGISTRSLRYYDEINLFSPDFYSDSGYRQYSLHQLTRLQLILFYKELGFSLEQIKTMLEEPDVTTHLTRQKQMLKESRNRIENLINLIDQTLKENRGEITMTEKAKFEAFKSKQLYDNENNYGNELRQHYDEKIIDASHRHFKGLSQKDYEHAVEVETQMFELLNHMLQNNSDDLNSEKAAAIFKYHQQWLQTMSGMYSYEYHRQLAELYVSDERFSSYYNTRTDGDAATLLKNIILYYTE